MLKAFKELILLGMESLPGPEISSSTAVCAPKVVTIIARAPSTWEGFPGSAISHRPQMLATHPTIYRTVKGVSPAGASFGFIRYRPQRTPGTSPQKSRATAASYPFVLPFGIRPVLQHGDLTGVAGIALTSPRHSRRGAIWRRGSADHLVCREEEGGGNAEAEGLSRIVAIEQKRKASEGRSCSLPGTPARSIRARSARMAP